MTYVRGGGEDFADVIRPGSQASMVHLWAFIMSPRDLLVTRPYVPGLRAWLMGRFVIEDVERESWGLWASSWKALGASWGLKH